MRIVLQGTPTKFAVPTAEQLKLDMWDNSYLSWVDLSGLKVPPILNSDVYDYRATGTEFTMYDPPLPEGFDPDTFDFDAYEPPTPFYGSVNWSEFHRPINLTGARFAPDTPSTKTDFIIEILRRASNATDPTVIKLREYMETYRPWYWMDGLRQFLTGEVGRLGRLATLPVETVRATFNEAFAGFPVILNDLHRYLSNHWWHAPAWGAPPSNDPAHIEVPIEVGNYDLDLSNEIGSVQEDRYAGGMMLQNVAKTRVPSKFVNNVKIHIFRLLPKPFIVAGTYHRKDDGWWMDRGQQ